jgi:hypothetical protein
MTSTRGSVVASLSSERGSSERPEPPRRPLLPAERLCILGAVVVAASLVLPWYDVAFSRVSETGLASFGFAHAALLLTVGAAVALILVLTRGYVLPRPFAEGVLLAIAGAWASVLVVYLMLDRPEQLAGSTEVGLRLGAFVALAGTLALVLGGLRLRRESLPRRRDDSV